MNVPLWVLDMQLVRILGGSEGVKMDTVVELRRLGESFPGLKSIKIHLILLEQTELLPVDFELKTWTLQRIYHRA